MHEWVNKAAGHFMKYGRSGLAGNNITNRGANIIDHIPSTHPSRNMVEAHFKSLRLFRKLCRLTPILLRIHNLYTKVNPVQAKINCARLFREKSHLRDPSIVDHYVVKGYDALSEAEQHYCQNTHLYQFFCPRDTTLLGDRGYSYLDEQKYGNKTTFLKSFYKGNRPNY